jgi:hypothetical protein
VTGREDNLWANRNVSWTFSRPTASFNTHLKSVFSVFLRRHTGKQLLWPSPVERGDQPFLIEKFSNAVANHMIT